MNYKKLPSAMAIAISLELILAPLPANANDNAKKALDMLNKGIETYQGIRGGGPPPPNHYFITDMEKLKAQIAPRVDKEFSLAKMQQIPGLMEYIAKKNQDASRTGGKPINPASLDCKTLQTTLTEVNTELCRNKSISQVNGVAPDVQAHEAMSYYRAYSEIEKRYTNYSAKSNEGNQGYGIGCMEDAMEVLKGFFAYRAEQMDYLNSELDKAFASFKSQQEAELSAIRRATAELGGEGSKFASEFNDTDLFDYGSKFAGVGCESHMGKDGLTNLGKEKGLTGLEKKLNEDLNTTPAGSNYSPASFIDNHSKIVADIKKMADKASERSTLEFGKIVSGEDGYTDFVSKLGGDLNSDTGVHTGLNKAFFTELQINSSKSRKKLTDSVNFVNSELGARGTSAIAMLADSANDVSFEAEIKSIEDGIKSECISKANIDVALTRMYDPKLSKQANAKSAEIIKSDIKAALDQPTTAKKLAALKVLDDTNGKRFVMKLDRDYKVDQKGESGEITSKKVKAASKVTAATFIGDIIQSCDSQFQTNKLKGKLSGKEAVKQLRTLKADYAKASTKYAKDFKDEILKKMIDCGDRDPSSSKVGSCSPGILDMSKPAFCAKGAFSCSQNIQKCNEKIANYTKNLRSTRQNSTRNYNANVDLLRKQLVNTFDNALAKYSQEGESLRGMFGAGFAPPADIQRDIEGDKAFNADFLGNAPDALKLKDPAALMSMMKENTKKLKDQILAQQENIIGKDGPFQKHLALTKENYEKNIIAKSKQIANDCLAAYNSFNQMLMDQNKLKGELGEKTAAFCHKYNEIMVQHIGASCGGQIGDLSQDVAKAAAKLQVPGVSDQAAALYKETVTLCASIGSQKDKDGKSTTTAQDVCREAESDKELQDRIGKYFSESEGMTNEKQKPAWEKVCAAVSGHRNYSKMCRGSESDTNEKGEPVKVKVDGCPDLKEAVIAQSRPNSKIQSSVSSTPPSSIATGSFCNASNNAGRFNPKGGLGEQPQSPRTPGAIERESSRQ